MLMVVLLLSGSLHALPRLDMVDGEPVVVEDSGFDNRVYRLLPNTLGQKYKKFANKDLGLKKSASVEPMENVPIDAPFFFLHDNEFIEVEGNRYTAFTEVYEPEPGTYYRYMKKGDGTAVKLCYKENPETIGHPIVARVGVVGAGLGIVVVAGKLVKYIYGKLFGPNFKKSIDAQEEELIDNEEEQNEDGQGVIAG